MVHYVLNPDQQDTSDGLSLIWGQRSDMREESFKGGEIHLRSHTSIDTSNQP